MDEARTARVEAKAAKARAKAMRPWYRKKRWILSIAFCGVVGIAAVGGAANSSSDSAAAGNVGSLDASSQPTSNAPLSHFTNKTHPAANDVDVSSCEFDDFGIATAHLAVTNHSSKQSDYIVSVEFANAHGTQVGTAAGLLDNVSAGQDAVSDAVGTISGSSAGVTCKIKSVDRMAS